MQYIYIYIWSHRTFSVALLAKKWSEKPRNEDRPLYPIRCVLLLHRNSFVKHVWQYSFVYWWSFLKSIYKQTGVIRMVQMSQHAMLSDQTDNTVPSNLREKMSQLPTHRKPAGWEFGCSSPFILITNFGWAETVLMCGAFVCESIALPWRQRPVISTAEKSITNLMKGYTKSHAPVIKGRLWFRITLHQNWWCGHLARPVSQVYFRNAHGGFGRQAGWRSLFMLPWCDLWCSGLPQYRFVAGFRAYARMVWNAPLGPSTQRGNA